MYIYMYIYISHYIYNNIIAVSDKYYRDVHLGFLESSLSARLFLRVLNYILHREFYYDVTHFFLEQMNVVLTLKKAI